MLQSTRRPSDGKAVWQRCDARSCFHCGPAKREQDLAHDIANLSQGGRPVLRRVIDPRVWNSLRAKVKRAESGWVAYPQRDGTLVVYAHGGMTGALVDCLTDELASDYAGLPAGARIRRPRDWALHKTPAGGGSTPAWKAFGESAVTHRTPDILQRLGLYRGQVDEAAVPLTAWEVHNFTVPPVESLSYRQLVDAFDLEGRRKAAAA